MVNSSLSYYTFLLLLLPSLLQLLLHTHLFHILLIQKYIYYFFSFLKCLYSPGSITGAMKEEIIFEM